MASYDSKRDSLRYLSRKRLGIDSSSKYSSKCSSSWQLASNDDSVLKSPMITTGSPGSRSTCL
jgi:hypothetical protein